jgi:hypothetical protein
MEFPKGSVAEGPAPAGTCDSPLTPSRCKGRAMEPPPNPLLLFPDEESPKENGEPWLVPTKGELRRAEFPFTLSRRVA